MNKIMCPRFLVKNLKPFAVVMSCLLACAAAHGGSPTTNRINVATGPIRSLTLHECIERALVNNIEIKSQRINPTIGTWGVIGAQGVYDPILSGSVGYQGAVPIAGSDSASIPALREDESLRELTLGAGLSGKLPTGATYDFSTANTRVNSDIVTNFVYSGNTVLSLTQPLWKNAGFSVNSAVIRIARENKSVLIQNFVQFVMTQMGAVSTAYYELIYAIENYKAAVENRDLAQQLLDETRKREQVGVQSPLDVIQAEAGVAESEEAVITTARTIKDNENALKRLICREVTEFRGYSLIPVDYPVVQMTALDVDESTRTALELRADYLSAMHSLAQQNIQVQFNKNQLWPEIDLQGSYGFNGLGTTVNGYADNETSGRSPVWMVGLTVSIPLGNRAARSNYQISKLDADQALLNVKGIEQNIVVQVDNAVGHVQTTLKSVEAARAATRLAQESLDAERKKLLAGTSTTFLVLQAQSVLATARSAEVRAFADYCESLFALDLADGTILRKNNIILKE
jgi:outer membrane protein TolC